MDRDTIAGSVAACASNQITGLLAEHASGILEAYQAAMLKHEAETPFKYRIALSLVLAPRGGDIQATAGITYSVRRHDETEPSTVELGPTLFDKSKDQADE